MRTAKVKSAERKATLSDVARMAGVATVTVSRFLNNHPSVSPKAAKEIRKAIKELQYSPNLAARMLMGQPSNAIGVIVPHLADPFYGQLAHSIQDEARKRGMLVWVSASDSNQETEFSIISQMKQHGVDGILLVPTPGERSHTRLKGDPPIVMLDRMEPGGFDAVIVENREASTEAVEHLLWHGYERILCVADDYRNQYTLQERVAGYKNAMGARNLEVQVSALQSLKIKDIQETVRSAMECGKSIQAIFATNNLASLYVLEALAALNMDIPLIGFDDFEWAVVARPSITVIRQPVAEMGRRAARLLLERLQNAEETTPETITLPTSLIIRQSCGCNFDSKWVANSNEQSLVSIS